MARGTNTDASSPPSIELSVIPPLTYWDSMKRLISSITASTTSDSTVLWEGTGHDKPSISRSGSYEDEPKDVNAVIVDRDWSQGFAVAVPSPIPRGPVQIIAGADGSVEVLAVGESRLTPAIHWHSLATFMNEFFSMRYNDAHSELHYQQEDWTRRKPLAIWSSLFLIANLVLGCMFIPAPGPVITIDHYFCYGFAAAFSLPVIWMVLSDFPRDRPVLYQFTVSVAAWSWAFYQVWLLLLCELYSHKILQCSSRDSQGISYYSMALPTIAMFGLKMNRFPATILAIIFFVFSSLVMDTRAGWSRQSYGNFLIFHVFIVLLHGMNEQSERRQYALWDGLKNTAAQIHKAQVVERKDADSKRRLTRLEKNDDYPLLPIFNVCPTVMCSMIMRVPLHTALLAVGNMEASKTVAAIEFDALTGSLNMMSQVLNDVLDFNRMDNNQFESSSRAYPFHDVMRSLMVSCRLATDARNLELVVDLDPTIDQVARTAAYGDLGETLAAIASHILASPNVDGMVLGDETHLRQIVTNFSSNAFKFTPAGGTVTVATRLVFPVLPVEDLESGEVDSLNSAIKKEESSSPIPPVPWVPDGKVLATVAAPLRKIVVRISVSDTGPGIRHKDLKADKLFSPFNQTEIGRAQASRGTGLGLSLVRQLVERSGGRLGVNSSAHGGSTFWVELPLGVGPDNMLGEGTAPPLPDFTRNSTTDHTAFARKVESAPDSIKLWPLKPVFPVAPKPQLPVSPPVNIQVVNPTPPSISAASSAHFASFDSNNAQKDTTKVGPDFARGLTVLCVDDDALTRTLMLRMLTRLGCVVTTAENGEVALKLILGVQIPSPSVRTASVLLPILERITAPVQEKNFNVIFLDNQMPVLSGLKVVEQLRKLGRADFVVGLTGNALLVEQQKFRDAGADHVLTKPARERHLREMLNLATQRLSHPVSPS